MHYPTVTMWRLLGLLALCLSCMAQPAAAYLPVESSAQAASQNAELLDSQNPVVIAASQDDSPYRYFHFSIGAQAAAEYFAYPSGVAVASDGSLYVADTDNHRIQRFGATGELLNIWGSCGSGDGQFYHPFGVAVTPDGTVYVADTENRRIQYFNATGTYLGQWGSSGIGNGQFSYPRGVVVAPDGVIYVADTGNNRIQYFNATGTYLGQWGTYGSGNSQFDVPSDVAVASNGVIYVADSRNNRIQYFNATGTYQGQWGTSGSGTGQFSYPQGIAVAPSGTVYVADSENYRIQYFNATGAHLGQWGTSGSGNGQFFDVPHVAVASNGTVYVADASNSRIQYFTATGTYLGQWGTYDSGNGQFLSPRGVAVAPDGVIYVANSTNDRIQYFNVTGAYLGQWGSSGSGSGQFFYPQSVAVAPGGTVYVADSGNNRIQYFDATGTYLGQWGTYGSGNSQFAGPSGVAVASNGVIYVADSENNRIQYFNATGAYLGQWGTYGSGNSQFFYPRGVAVAPGGTVYVADTDNNRIQYFNATGTYLGRWGAYGSGNGQFRSPQGVAVAPGGTVYVADSYSRIQHFSSTGTYLGQWGAFGPGDNQFHNPSGVAVASDGMIYVADTFNQRIQAFGMAYLTTWRGEYFGNRWLAGLPALIRDDSEINFEWASGSPDTALPSDYFSSRWQRYVYFANPGYFRFTMLIDDGGRLWVDDALVMEEWRHPQRQQFTRTIFLETGYHKIRLEHYEYDGWAAATLSWALEPPTVPILNTITNTDADGDYTVSWIPFHTINFETGAEDFSGQGSWTWGTVGPYGGARPDFPTGAHSGVKAWATNLTGDYANSEDIYLTSPLINLSSYQGALALSWWQWLYTETDYDYASVEVRGGGAGWSGIYGPVSGAVDLQWTEHTYNLSAFSGVSDFQVRFHFTSDSSSVYPGWYVDDVTIPGVSGATSYTLQEATNSSFTNPTTAYSGSNISTVLSGKAPGTYYYRIKASNTGGDSPWSNVQSVVVVALPTAPTLNAIANADGDGNYTVGWSTVSVATSYTLQEATNSGFTGATTTYSGSGTSTSIAGKAPGTYYYRVRSSNVRGGSPWSNVQSVVVIALPIAPTLNAIANADGDGNYSVSWSAVSVATGYTLQEANNSSFTGATTAYSGSGTTTSITGKVPGTYYYRVRSSNIRGDSPWSNTQSVVAVAPPTAPTLNAIANTDGDGNYTVSWGSVSGATGYTLQEAGNSGFTGATTAYSGSGTSTNISGKTPGTYYYRARASNGGGAGAWSNTQAVVVIAAPEAPPLNPIANDDGDGNYNISWGFVDGATTYTLQEATSSSFANAATIYAGGGTLTSVSNRPLGIYYYRVRATNVVGDSSWSAARSVVVSVETGDGYEPDDICTQARSMSTDGTVQERTFHKQADEDWVVFSVTAGVTYRIEAQVPLESPADVAVEVYDQCAGVPVDGQDHAFAAGVRLEFTASTTGLFYLKWFNHDPDIFGADVVYEISMRALATEAQPGAVIIVAGRYKYNDPLQPNIHYAASQIYQMFQNNGYPADRIYYLSTDLTQPGANALATVSNLQTTISTWTLDKVNADHPLTLFLVDHGMPNQIYLDRPKGEAVTPTQLDTWLTQLETARPGLKVNIIMEACYSGSFIGLPQSLSKIGRVVVASTSATDLAYASVRGAVFSDYFSAALTQGASVYSAFESARGATRSGYPYQNPWLDANGNSIPNEAADAQIAALRGFAYAGTLSGDQWPPYIAQTTPVAVAGGRGNLRVEVRDDDAVRYVWAVIYPPSYTPPVTQEELVQETLPTAMLLTQGNGWYGAQYTGFDEMGEYRVVFYAEDDLGLSAQPVAIMVQTGWAVYLPVVIKQ